MNDQHDLEVIIQSRFPIIVADTYEESRVLRLLERLARLKEWALFDWSVISGLRRRDVSKGPIPQTRDPGDALRHIDATPHNGIYVLLDFHPYLKDPVNIRLLKEIALGYDNTPRTVILVSHQVDLPAELRRMAARFELSVPDRHAIKIMINEEIERWRSHNRGMRLKGDRDAVELLIQHLTGMLAGDARRLVRQAINDDNALTMTDLDRVIKAKRTLAGAEGVLSFETDTANFSGIAGLGNLKRWLAHRRPAFIGDAQTMGLDVPKGVLLLGIQGCGKSLAAKSVAGSWRVPLMRLDLGAIYNKYLGETERNLRESLKMADAVAPCVLWIDEIEKGVAPSDLVSDGGESRRVLGALLTWMAERRSRVFLVATANDIKSLPPELIRKGRFDEIFFVDLPDPACREEILKIHLARRKHDAQSFNLHDLSEACEGFSGAEIEQAVVSALYEAAAASEPLSARHILAEMRRTRPLSVIMAERVRSLRSWAKDRAVMAH